MAWSSPLPISDCQLVSDQPTQLNRRATLSRMRWGFSIQCLTPVTLLVRMGRYPPAGVRLPPPTGMTANHSPSGWEANTTGQGSTPPMAKQTDGEGSKLEAGCYWGSGKFIPPLGVKPKRLSVRAPYPELGMTPVATW